MFHPLRRVALLFVLAASAHAELAVDIGSRRELFVDDLLVGELKGTTRKLHSPQKLPPIGPAMPWGAYSTVIKDGDRYRLYYRGDKVPGMHWKQGWGPYHENEVTLYAESKDGRVWTEPNLGIYQIPSMPKGNVMLNVNDDTFLVTHNFSPFKDARPGVPAAERYKALGGGRYPPSNWTFWKPAEEREKLRAKYGVGGLKAFASPDGIHWKIMQKAPVLDEEIGNYDSQNVSFWSEAEQLYVCYYRWAGTGVRGMRRVTSPDFLHWSKPVDMKANQPGEHLYTSGTQPYFRAPHLYIALATRFQAGRSAITDIVFMSTRPGSDHYDRLFKEAFIRPGIGQEHWGDRSNYIAWNVVPTSGREMSLFMTGGDHYVLRTDGFISVNAGYEEGEFVTKPFVFTGKALELNYSTAAAGMLRVELQDAGTGAPLAAFALDDCQKIWGDEIARIVKWGKGAAGTSDVSVFAGRPVRLRFVMNESDIFSMKFNE